MDDELHLEKFIDSVNLAVWLEVTALRETNPSREELAKRIEAYQQSREWLDEGGLYRMCDDLLFGGRFCKRAFNLLVTVLTLQIVFHELDLNERLLTWAQTYHKYRAYRA